MGQAKRDRRLQAVQRRERKSKPTPSARPEIQQDSRLLRLQPEVRSRIYEAVVFTQWTVTARRAELMTPPLTRTCRQLRREYLLMFHTTILRTARRIECKVYNFEFDKLLDMFSQLPQETKDIIKGNKSLVFQLISKKDIEFVWQIASLKRWLHACGGSRAVVPSGQYELVGRLPKAIGSGKLANDIPSPEHTEWMRILYAWRERSRSEMRGRGT